MDDEMKIELMKDEASCFEVEVFEMLFGADARPPKTAEEYGKALPRVFSYEDAREALADLRREISS